MAEKSNKSLVKDKEEEAEVREGAGEGMSPSGIDAPAAIDHSEDGATDAVGMPGQRKARVQSIKGTASPTKKG